MLETQFQPVPMLKTQDLQPSCRLSALASQPPVGWTSQDRARPSMQNGADRTGHPRPNWTPKTSVLDSPTLLTFVHGSVWVRCWHPTSYIRVLLGGSHHEVDITLSAGPDDSRRPENPECGIPSLRCFVRCFRVWQANRPLNSLTLSPLFMSLSVCFSASLRWCWACSSRRTFLGM